jgi:hypothetical protein
VRGALTPAERDAGARDGPHELILGTFSKLDVVIVAYLIPDLAKQDFDTLVTLVEDDQLKVEGVALVTVDADGTAASETGDHCLLPHRGQRYLARVGL